jgi:heterodisulfide reductase subunit D
MAQAKTKPKKTFDPRVLVFACNWCSYAGADTAGISRLAQTPHFRLLRVMCSGRVHPSFVLRAFARGADGVMVSGCHFGDCHYRFGNYKAVEQYERLTELMAMLGIDSARSRLEWISAAEGVRFAKLMNEFVEDVRSAGPSPIAPPGGIIDAEAVAVTPEPADLVADMRETGVLSCLECGRCTAVCPLTKHQNFSARRLVSKTVSGGLDALANEPALWTCLTCERCSVVCPVSVDYSEFILKARANAVSAGKKAETVGIVPCSHGGVFEQISELHTRPELRQERLGWVQKDMNVEVVGHGETAKGTDLLFTGCSPYFAAYFGEGTGEGLIHSLQSTVRLLNRGGITPVLLSNERCCGYHATLSGHSETAAELATLVAEQIIASGVKRVISHCPECMIALKKIADAADHRFDVLHLSEVLCADIEPLASSREGNGRELRTTYQDPCRLGRKSGLYDYPRRLIKEVAGAELTEMEHNRERAICCGNTAWLNCNAATKSFQNERLSEANATGSKRLVTACPGCYIHLRCAQEGAADQDSEQIEVTDIWSLLAGTPPDLGGSKETEG